MKLSSSDNTNEDINLESSQTLQQGSSQDQGPET